MKNEIVQEHCENLAKNYDCDISSENLVSECMQFKHYINETRENEI